MQNQYGQGYVKYTYFLTLEELNNIRQWAKQKCLSMYKARDLPCEPLHPQRKIGYVSPEVWNRRCKRQGSWYRESFQAGKYLVISSFKLDYPQKGTKLSFSDFFPPLLPSKEEQLKMIKSEVYQRRKPGDWERFAEHDILRFKTARLELSKTEKNDPAQREEEFPDVFLTHCANHSNFLDPCYYIREGSETFPYSIGDTFHVCSSCVEFFNLAGEKFKCKFVVPCPGAVLYAKLPINKYFQVESL